MSLITSILLAIAIVVVLWAVYTFNRFIGLRNQMKEAWSGIDVQLKLRHDLIPSLVETVKGYRAHEQKLLEDLTRLRTQATSAHGVASATASEKALTENLRSLFAVAEAYPELKADQNFRQLSANLVDIEDKIQYARRYYNGSVRDYNNLVESFPSLLIAYPFKFKPAEFFEVETVTERKNVDIKL